ncbi:hypothetical protein PROFUN_16017 [Planoprotostelium fungivorum]|uniref:Uncharacterized protein n=1 Tax=Planoprotostelium fungivorum TaxID=1890364 RepID=A0A2P6MT61_9EUKA|nr:hypothetical protein PROFUN_16017 [Planoprotostelium fungivorum]
MTHFSSNVTKALTKADVNVNQSPTDVDVSEDITIIATPPSSRPPDPEVIGSPAPSPPGFIRMHRSIQKKAAQIVGNIITGSIPEPSSFLGFLIGAKIQDRGRVKDDYKFEATIKNLGRRSEEEKGTEESSPWPSHEHCGFSMMKPVVEFEWMKSLDRSGLQLDVLRMGCMKYNRAHITTKRSETRPSRITRSAMGSQ